MINGRIAAAVAAAAVGLGMDSHAGDAATYGYGAEFAIRALDLVVAPKVLDQWWGQLHAGGWFDNQSDGTFRFEIKQWGNTIVEGQATFALEDGKVRTNWSIEAKRDFSGHGLILDVQLPIEKYAGGTFTGDGKATALPVDPPESYGLAGGRFREMEFRNGAGKAWTVTSPEEHLVSVQDNRTWKMPFYGVRIIIGDDNLVAGQTYTADFTFSTTDGIDSLKSSIYRVERGANWIPIDDTTAIVPGSAIDFSTQPWLDAPAGKYGWVKAVGDHFEFEGKPGEPQRFYGVNLCFDANYMTAEEAEECVSRIARIGYNSIRIHHYEQALCKGSEDGSTINPEQMAKLDNLLNACIKHGVYLTTDVFVSRAPTWKSLGEDKPGSPNISEYKDMCLFNDKAYESLCGFARQLLGHVNPATGRRWAEEPALGWIAFINEGNPGNYGFGIYRRPEALAKWKAWLAEKKKADPRFADVTEGFDNNCWLDDNRQTIAFTLFLADLGADFDKRFGAFLREELGCKALFTNMSCWFNPLVYQLNRTKYDYIDDHFYVDHPEFIVNDWSLPSKCGNANPVRTPTVGFQHVANHRLLDKPFTITEYNFCAPSAWRGVGGIMLGAEAALQDYDGVWRFDWGTGVEFDWRPLAYFDACRDPLTRATERAALCLYMRRDMKPLKKTFALLAEPSKIRGDLARGPRFDVKDTLWFGWYSKFGSFVGDEEPAFADWVGRYPEVSEAKDDYFQAIVDKNGLTPGDGQMILDREKGVFGVVTPRTCGFSTEGGKASAGPLSADVSLAAAAVWASSLDDQPIATSKHLLVSHVTDVQDHGITFADDTRKVLLKWGWIPHVMERGKAEIALRLNGDATPVVHALKSDGSRWGQIPSEFKDGVLTFTADTAHKFDSATFMYEIVR